MNKAKTYNKYLVTRTVGGKGVKKNEDGTPVLGECVKTNIRITPDLAELLNHGWDSIEKPISFYHQEVKERVVNEKTPERIELESEAKELGVQFRENIGDDTLKERIANHKQN